MAIIAAIVRVQIRSLELLSQGVKDAVKKAPRAYVRGAIGPFITGRSAPLVPTTESVNLMLDTAIWSAAVRVAAGEAISILLELWDASIGDAPIHSLTGSVAAPWTEGLVTLSSGDLKAVFDVVETRLVPPPNPVAVVPRAAAGTTTQATVRIANKILVEITDVQGLFAPTVAKGATRAAGTKGASAKAGYKSLDHRGRIFLNRRRDDTWKADHQSIEITAEVTRVEGLLPDDLEIEWTVLDVDDPSDDDPDMHLEWGAYMDPSDYKPDGTFLRGRTNDNEGAIDANPRWEAKPPLGLTIDSDRVARTTVVRGKSAVVVHCPSLAGDNLVVVANAVSRAMKLETFPDQTGTMTMWNRIDVEYRKMKSAASLPVDEIPAHFEPLCAQLDIHRENDELADVDTVAKGGEKDLIKKFYDWTVARFKHRNQAGWLCLIAAKRAVPFVPTAGTSLFKGNVTLMSGTASSTTTGDSPSTTSIDTDFFLMAPLADRSITLCRATFRWSGSGVTPPAAREVTLSAEIRPIDDKRVHIQINANSEFLPIFRHIDAPTNGTMDDGVPLLLLTTRQQLSISPTWASGGYGVPASVEVELRKRTAGSGIIAGLTATAPRLDEAAAPQSAVFTTDHVAGGFPLLHTAVHELSHALGLSHKCAFFDYHVLRSRSCAMAYSSQWLLAGNADLHLDDQKANQLRAQPGSAGNPGPDLCGRHIKEGRRIHLEDHPGLKWK